MDLGVVGLGVMGENLIWNIADKGYSVGVYNRTTAKTERFIARVADGQLIRGFKTLSELVAALRRPRKLLLMVAAGQAVDQLLEQLVPLLDPSDTVIDGGNSNYRDTERRCQSAAGRWQFLGCGISGGEEGARHGPSIMPGGSEAGWAAVAELLQRIAARSPAETPCCEWIGQGGSGHLVKTVHNGIEYAEMQIIADFYQLLRGSLSPLEIAGVFEQWKASGTGGFLLETAQLVLGKRSGDGSGHLIDQIVDVSEQKGTGVWTVEESLSYHAPVPGITSAVLARMVSAQRELRQASARKLPAGEAVAEAAAELPLSPEEMRRAFLLCRALAYLQGFNLIERIAEEKGWGISLPVLCRIWSNGCIIRSEFLGTLAEMCQTRPLVHSEAFVQLAAEGIGPLRRLVSFCVLSGTNAPCLNAALSDYDGLRTAKSSGNMIQALRDFFGAHTLLLEGAAEKVHIKWRE